MKLRLALSLMLLCLAALSAAAHAARTPDPSVHVQIMAPVEKTSFLPNDKVRVEVAVTDPFMLVRRVFVRLNSPGGRAVNASQEAVRRGGLWVLEAAVPTSAVEGQYKIKVEVHGDGNTPLQWAETAIEVKPATFAVKLLSPGADAVFHRNEAFDVVAQIEDPRNKTRRVFVYFEDLKARKTLNGDREARRRGNLWSQKIYVPATTVPSQYQVRVKVLGEGMEPLAEEKIAVSIGMAPVSLGNISLEPATGMRVGQTVRATISLLDPRGVVRQVLVTCSGPEGKTLLSRAAASRTAGGWTRDLVIDDDQPYGTWAVEFMAVGQNNEVLGTQRLEFTVQPRR